MRRLWTTSRAIYVPVGFFRLYFINCLFRFQYLKIISFIYEKEHAIFGYKITEKLAFKVFTKEVIGYLKKS